MPDLDLAVMGAESAEAQEALGRRLAAVCPSACVIYLRGDLGAGKTTLVRGFLHGLGHEGVVKSPTYTLIEPYQLRERLCFHLDLYRLSDPGELEYLGLGDLLQSAAILLVEWPERGFGGLPDPDLLITITYAKQGRRLQLRAVSESGRRILSYLTLVNC